MDKAALVGVLESKRRLADEIARSGYAERTGLFDFPGQVDAIDVFHRQVMSGADAAGVVGDDDVGMRQLSCGPDFLIKPLHGRRTGQLVLADDLESDHAAHTVVPRLEHLAHRALAETVQ